jgi:ABC-type Zn2+ transport system substrate-binding protein/surface adhesin
MSLHHRVDHHRHMHDHDHEMHRHNKRRRRDISTFNPHVKLKLYLCMIKNFKLFYKSLKFLKS